MSINKKTLLAATIATVIAASNTPSFAHIKPGDLEKCYGIVKSGKNDCASSNSNACAGQDMKDGDPNAWILVPKGTCQKIVNGSLKPASTSTTKQTS